MNESLKFTVFSDLHYKKHMYAASIADHLEPIIERAHSSGSDFILHAGDLCNDYNGSKELTNSLLKNKYSLPVYGVYGNHELETRGNTMEVVTPLLTNRTVSFGTPDGRFSSEIGYYHFDIKGFRIICTDTNYSQLNGEWVHNLPASWGPPNGAENQNALSPKQLDWLESTLNDAADKGLKCIVVSHAEFSGKHPGRSSSDHKRFANSSDGSIRSEKLSSLQLTVITTPTTSSKRTEFITSTATLSRTASGFRQMGSITLRVRPLTLRISTGTGIRSVTQSRTSALLHSPRTHGSSQSRSAP